MHSNAGVEPQYSSKNHRHYVPEGLGMFPVP